MGKGPKVEAPKPGPYEKVLAERAKWLAPFEKAYIWEYASWSLPSLWRFTTPEKLFEGTAGTSVASATEPPDMAFPENLLPPGSGSLPQPRRYWEEIKDLPPWELYSLMQQEDDPYRYKLLEYAYKQKAQSWSAPTPGTDQGTTPAETGQELSPTRPPTYMLAPYMEAIEKEYGRAKEAIAGMRPGGAKEKAMLELEAYWKPHAKASAIRALYEEARSAIASILGEYGPTMRTLVGLEQQRAAWKYQADIAAAQQQASMWSSLGGLASLGLIGILRGKLFA